MARKKLPAPNSQLPTPNSLGARIRAARGKLPCRKLAESLDCDPQSIYRWERGDCEPSLATLRRLARALGVSAGELVGD